jgi:hypothetical protein
MNWTGALLLYTRRLFGLRISRDGIIRLLAFASLLSFPVLRWGSSFLRSEGGWLVGLLILRREICSLELMGGSLIEMLKIMCCTWISCDENVMLGWE